MNTHNQSTAVDQHSDAFGKQSDNALDPKMVWLTVRHCWHWALPTGIALAAVGVLGVFVNFVPVFRASHLLEKNTDYVVFEGAMEQSHSLSTELQLMQSDIVLDTLANDPEVQGALEFSSVEAGKLELKESMSILAPGGGKLLEVSFINKDPAAAATVCNKIADSYLDIRGKFDRERVRDLESWLAPSLEYWKNEVETHEERVRELSRQRLGFDPSEAVAVLENSTSALASLRTQLADLVVEEEVLRAEAMALNGKQANSTPDDEFNADDAPEPTPSEIEGLVSANPDVVKWKQRIAETETTIRGMELQGLAPLRQDYIDKLQGEIQNYQADLETATEVATQEAKLTYREQWLDRTQRARQQSAAALARDEELSKQTMRGDLARLSTRKQILQDEYDKEKARLERKGSDSADLFFAQEDRATAVSILTSLSSRLAEIQTEQRRGSGVRSLAEATPPTRPVEPVPFKSMSVAALAGLGFPFLIGFLFEFRTKRISDAKTLESMSSKPIVGEVARLPNKANGKRRQRIFEESIDTLRANLLLAKNTKNVRSITVASSMSGEGKSSVASQLAISLAKSCGKTVLLIDADLRSPDQHDIFGIDMGGGLSKVLSGDKRLDDEIDKSLGDLVHVLPAGRMHLSPHRLLNSNSVKELIDDALTVYQFVVIDTAPVLAAGETLGVASETDATLICVMRDVSRSDTLMRTTRRLEASGANVVGTVFSGVPANQYAYRYGDYRYHQPVTALADE